MKRQHHFASPRRQGVDGPTKRPRHAKTATTTPRYVSFYAVRPSAFKGGEMLLEEPIIFFGLKDLTLYAKYLQSQSSSSSADSVIVVYEEFDNLANAMEYVQTTTTTVRGGGGEKERHIAEEEKEERNHQTEEAPVPECDSATQDTISNDQRRVKPKRQHLTAVNQNEKADSGAVNSRPNVPRAELGLSLLEWAAGASHEPTTSRVSDNKRTFKSNNERVRKPQRTPDTTRQSKQPPALRPPPRTSPIEQAEDKQQPGDNTSRNVAKKRGRPRGKRLLAPESKQPPVEEDKRQTNNDDTVVKKRGRPRGKRSLASKAKAQPPIEEEEEKDSQHGNNSSSPPNTVKKRGRPRGKRLTLSPEPKQTPTLETPPSDQDGQQSEDVGQETDNDDNIHRRDPGQPADPRRTQPLGAQEGQQADSIKSRNKGGRPPGKRNAWEENFHLLCQFKEEFGHCKVPSTIPLHSTVDQKYKVLCAWTRTQRKTLTNFSVEGKNEEEMSLTDTLMVKRRQRLQDIGFEFYYKPFKNVKDRQEEFDRQFQKYLQDLKDFKNKHGHINLPSGTTLYSWLWRQRKAYNVAMQNSDGHHPTKSLLTLQHIGALKELGVTMEMKYQRTTTRKSVQDYVDFVKTHNRTPVQTSPNEDEARLARNAAVWKRERHRYEKQQQEDGNAAATNSANANLPPPDCQFPIELIEALDSVGFNWVIKAQSKPRARGKFNKYTPWETKFQAVKDYIAKYGMEPTKRHKELGYFVNQTRQQYKRMVKGQRYTMTLDQFRKLTEAGFRFKVGRERRYGFEGSDGGEDSSSEDEGGGADEEDVSFPVHSVGATILNL